MRISNKEHQVGFRRAKGLVCVYEAAQILGASRQTVYRWEDAGMMPGRITMGGTRRYYRREDILAMAAIRQTLLLGEGTE
ncbi:helix-turn-helix domain-containing protein [Reyranella sp.]|uniref:helix-turn-helix domain-containing protein n=1 Tax=Reyranella sp. TaxID=1929291 RepID=UPI0040368AB1